MDIPTQNSYRANDLDYNKETKSGEPFFYFDFKYENFKIKVSITTANEYYWVFFVEDHEGTEIIRSFAERYKNVYDSYDTYYRLYKKLPYSDIYKLLN